jgi:hypothetical protein
MDPSAARVRYDEIIQEIDRVQKDDPLGRRNLLKDIASALNANQPSIARAIEAALKEIPENPGLLGQDGARANRAETLLLDAMRFGLFRPVSGPPGADVEQILWRLLRLGKENVDPSPNQPEAARASALLGWQLLAAVHGILGTERNYLSDLRGMRPSSQPSLPNDMQAAAMNGKALDEIFDREVNLRNKKFMVGSLGRPPSW